MSRGALAASTAPLLVLVFVFVGRFVAIGTPVHVRSLARSFQFETALVGLVGVRAAVEGGVDRQVGARP